LDKSAQIILMLGAHIPIGKRAARHLPDFQPRNWRYSTLELEVQAISNTAGILMWQLLLILGSKFPATGDGQYPKPCFLLPLPVIYEKPHPD
jgi:hypothetical protein